MGRRWQRLVGEASRFLTVGAAATLVAVVLFNVLVHGLNPFGWAPLNDQPELGYVVANFVGMLISFGGTKQWAFRHRETSHPDGGFVAYSVINVVTMTLPVGCLWVSRHVLGLDSALADNVAANVIGLALGNGARFVLFRRFVFERSAPRRDPAEEPVEEPAEETASRD